MSIYLIRSHNIDLTSFSEKENEDMKKHLVSLIYSILFSLLVVNTKVKVLNFDTDITVGKRTSSDATYIEARKKSKFKRLFVHRKHFKKKIRESVNEL